MSESLRTGVVVLILELGMKTAQGTRWPRDLTASERQSWGPCLQSRALPHPPAVLEEAPRAHPTIGLLGNRVSWPGFLQRVVQMGETAQLPCLAASRPPKAAIHLALIGSSPAASRMSRGHLASLLSTFSPRLCLRRSVFLSVPLLNPCLSPSLSLSGSVVSTTVCLSLCHYRSLISVFFGGGGTELSLRTFSLLFPLPWEDPQDIQPLGNALYSA